MRRVVTAGLAGSVIEYYDFGVFAFLTVVIGPLFFPGDDPAASTLSALLVFGSGYVIRPVGGIVLGHLGDRIGRRPVLIGTVVGIGMVSVLIGVLPTYAQVGVLAPVLLLLLRLGQGFVAGGELVGAVALLAESAPARRRGFYGSLGPLGSSGGYALAALVVGAVTAVLGPAAMSEWGWRVPFLLCLPLTVVSLFLRRRLEDGAEFRRATARSGPIRAPLVHVLRDHRRPLLRVVAVTVALNGAGYIGLAYLPVYLRTVAGLDGGLVYWTTSAAIALSALTIPLFGIVGDRVGRATVLRWATLAYVVLAYGLFWLMGTSSIVVVGLAYLLFMTINSAQTGPGLTAFADLFPPEIRYTAMAVGFNIGVVAAGGFGPYFAALLVRATGDPLAAAVLVVGVSVIGLLGLVGLPRAWRAERDLRESAKGAV